MARSRGRRKGPSNAMQRGSFPGWKQAKARRSNNWRKTLTEAQAKALDKREQRRSQRQRWTETSPSGTAVSHSAERESRWTAVADQSSSVWRAPEQHAYWGSSGGRSLLHMPDQDPPAAFQPFKPSADAMREIQCDRRLDRLYRTISACPPAPVQLILDEVPVLSKASVQGSCLLGHSPTFLN